MIRVKIIFDKHFSTSKDLYSQERVHMSMNVKLRYPNIFLCTFLRKPETFCIFIGWISSDQMIHIIRIRIFLILPILLAEIKIQYGSHFVPVAI